MCMFPACCFRQRIFSNLLVFCLDVGQGYMNGALNETRTFKREREREEREPGILIYYTTKRFYYTDIV